MRCLRFNAPEVSLSRRSAISNAMRPKIRFTQPISEKVKITPVIDNRTNANKVIYTEPEIDELQQSVFN